MKRLWLFIFPLLFLPTFGHSITTQFGVLETSDLLILPFVTAVLLSPHRKRRQQLSTIYGFCLVFAVWALFSTLTMLVRYPTEELTVEVYCILKLGKAVLFVMAIVMMVKRLDNPQDYSNWLWSLLGAMMALSIGAFVEASSYAEATTEIGVGSKTYNEISVAIAILTSYVAGLWFAGIGNRKWRIAAALTVVLAPLSLVLTTSEQNHGRGGWVALGAGLSYLIWTRLRSVSVLKSFSAVVALAIICGLLIGAYSAVPKFRDRVNETVFAKTDYAPIRTSYGELDDGERFSIWVDEAPKLIDSPVLGTGFFHRGGESSIAQWGSHNYFIQIFLETGLVGGICVLAIFWRMWQGAGCAAAREAKVAVATRSALIAAVVGGMSGEYFYGGLGLLALFAAYAWAGSRPQVRIMSRRTVPLVHIQNRMNPQALSARLPQ